MPPLQPAAPAPAQNATHAHNALKAETLKDGRMKE
jgi:hypothetical protein